MSDSTIEREEPEKEAYKQAIQEKGRSAQREKPLRSDDP